MKINDVIEASRNGQYVIMEDPLNGSHFLKNKEEFTDSYICIDGSIIPLEKITCAKIDETEANVTINGSKVITIMNNENVLLLTKRHIFSESELEFLNKTYDLSRDDTIRLNIYDCILAPMRIMNSYILNGRYPYIQYNVGYNISTRQYMSNINIIFNSDVIAPRQLNFFSDEDMMKVSLGTLNYIENQINTPQMDLLFNGYYIYIYDESINTQYLLKLLDIHNNTVIFKNFIDDSVLMMDSNNVFNMVSNAKFIYKNCNCVLYNKDVDELYNFGKHRDTGLENFADIYSKDDLISIINQCKKLIEDSNKESLSIIDNQNIVYFDNNDTIELLKSLIDEIDDQDSSNVNCDKKEENKNE